MSSTPSDGSEALATVEMVRDPERTASSVSEADPTCSKESCGEACFAIFAGHPDGAALYNSCAVGCASGRPTAPRPSQLAASVGKQLAKDLALNGCPDPRTPEFGPVVQSGLQEAHTAGLVDYWSGCLKRLHLTDANASQRGCTTAAPEALRFYVPNAEYAASTCCEEAHSATDATYSHGCWQPSLSGRDQEGDLTVANPGTWVCATSPSASLCDRACFAILGGHVDTAMYPSCATACDQAGSAPVPPPREPNESAVKLGKQLADALAGPLAPDTDALKQIIQKGLQTAHGAGLVDYWNGCAAPVHLGDADGPRVGCTPASEQPLRFYMHDANYVLSTCCKERFWTAPVATYQNACWETAPCPGRTDTGDIQGGIGSLGTWVCTGGREPLR